MRMEVMKEEAEESAGGQERALRTLRLELGEALKAVQVGNAGAEAMAALHRELNDTRKQLHLVQEQTRSPSPRERRLSVESVTVEHMPHGSRFTPRFEVGSTPGAHQLVHLHEEVSTLKSTLADARRQNQEHEASTATLRAELSQALQNVTMLQGKRNPTPPRGRAGDESPRAEQLKQLHDEVTTLQKSLGGERTRLAEQDALITSLRQELKTSLHTITMLNGATVRADQQKVNQEAMAPRAVAKAGDESPRDGQLKQLHDEVTTLQKSLGGERTRLAEQDALITSLRQELKTSLRAITKADQQKVSHEGDSRSKEGDSRSKRTATPPRIPVQRPPTPPRGSPGGTPGEPPSPRDVSPGTPRSAELMMRLHEEVATLQKSLADERTRVADAERRAQRAERHVGSSAQEHRAASSSREVAQLRAELEAAKLEGERHMEEAAQAVMAMSSAALDMGGAGEDQSSNQVVVAELHCKMEEYRNELKLCRCALEEAKASELDMDRRVAEAKSDANEARRLQREAEARQQELEAERVAVAELPEPRGRGRSRSPSVESGQGDREHAAEKARQKMEMKRVRDEVAKANEELQRGREREAAAREREMALCSEADAERQQREQLEVP